MAEPVDDARRHGFCRTESRRGARYRLVERASEGQLRLSEMTALFWHCLAENTGIEREELGEAVASLGLAACAAPLRQLLGQILQGRA